MAITVEDGTGVANANSYISIADAQAILTARGLSTTVTEASLLQAMDALTGLDWCGDRVDDDQALDWPRSYVHLSDNRLNASDNIPQELKNAQTWAAHYILSGSDPSSVSTAGVKREKVDVLEVEYKDSQITNKVTLSQWPNVANNLKYLVCGGLSGSMRIDRA